MHQPKVIAEVLGGILLGPTAFGRIPGFTEHIFPSDSRPYLSLTANIGLCLFLFLVGLEIDAAVIRRNARLSVTVALAGMVIPFGIGAGLSRAVYKQFIDPSIQFTHFMLFTGVAYSITAFPVLCRILTELKLLDTTVGIVVLSAGVGNDIV
jgi:Kef-type K+ transport system membrane component KefB